MPCRDPGYEDYDNYEREDRFQDLTRMLCAVMEKLEKKGIANQFRIKGLNAWWSEHQEKDRERLEYEAEEQRLDRIRNDALAKLTKEECDALSIY